MLLAANALGLGSCWVSGFEEGMIRRIVNLPSNLIPYGVLPIGYAAETPEKDPGQRIEHVVDLENYNNQLKYPLLSNKWYRGMWPVIGKTMEKAKKKLSERVKHRVVEIKDRIKRRKKG